MIRWRRQYRAAAGGADRAQLRRESHRHNKRQQLLAEQLHHTLVLQGDATDEELLDQENIAAMDVFCALTNDDEDNIMSALLAKRMGATVIA